MLRGGVQVCDYLVHDLSFGLMHDVVSLEQDRGRNIVRKKELKGDSVVSWVHDATLEIKHALLEVDDFLLGPHLIFIVTSLPFDLFFAFDKNFQIFGRHLSLTADIDFAEDLVARIIIRSIKLDKDLTTFKLRI